MLYLLKNTKSQATSPHAFAEVVSILNHATQMPHQFKTDHQVAPSRLLPTPVPDPRMTLQPHLLNTTQHDTTFAGKLLDPVTGWLETIDTLLASKDKTIWLKSLANEIGRCSIRLCKFANPMRKSVARTQFSSSNLLKCHHDARSPTSILKYRVSGWLQAATDLIHTKMFGHQTLGFYMWKYISIAQNQMHTSVPGTAQQTSETSFFAPPWKSNNTCI